MGRCDRCEFQDMTRRDLPDIIEITRINMGEIIRDAWGVVWDHEFEESFSGNLTTSGIVKVIYIEGDVAGYFWFSKRDEEDLFINSIQLRSDCQRQGIGLQVLNWIESKALAQGIQRLRLAVQETNLKAIEFYKRYGFREVLYECKSIHMLKEIS